jgi:thiamine-phosphate pyrophosphorylase
MNNLIDFSLYLITDRQLVPHGHTLISVVEEALRGGVKAVQLREKDLSIDALRPLALDLRELTARYQAKLLINHHVELALNVNADGVHLGGHSLPTMIVRDMIGPDKLIGVSTHKASETIAAADQGADFVTFGPVYSTPSKSQYGPPQGLLTLAAACKTSPIPVFALGGIKPDNANEVLAAGSHGIALISAIIASPCPQLAAQAFIA